MDRDNNFSMVTTIASHRERVSLRRWIFPLAVVVLMGWGCSKTADSPDWDYMYRYFPLQEGHWTIYQVDSTAYNSLLDSVKTYRYYVKEELGTPYTDLSGNQWTRVKVDYSPDTLFEWTSMADFAQRVTAQTGERLENNLHFIKLTFPFKKFSWWAGNSYIHYDDYLNCNFLGDWEYQYKDLYVSKMIHDHPFDSLVVIQQAADSGLICKNLAIEMYAPRVGLVYKHIERLTTQKTTSDPFWIRAEDGYILTYTIIDWKRD